MTSASILEGLTVAVESTLLSNKSCVGEPESQFSSRDSVLVAAGDKLSSTGRRLSLMEDAVSAEQEQGKGHGCQLGKVETGRATADSDCAKAECTECCLLLRTERSITICLRVGVYVGMLTR